MRGISYSYSPSPSRGGYSRRRRSPSPRGRRYGGSSRNLRTSLLVHNLSRDCRPEDLRRSFGEFGPLKDVYLPRDYYLGEPRGFGFVQYVDPADAAEAKYHMNGRFLLGRELTVVFAEENRKKPVEMRAKERLRRRSYDRGSISRSPGCSSPSPSPRRSCYSRSISPEDQRYKERSYSRSSYGSRYKGRSYSRSPYYSRSSFGSRYRERSFSMSTYGSGYRERSYSRSPYGSKYRGRSYSRSPYQSPEDY